MDYLINIQSIRKNIKYNKCIYLFDRPSWLLQLPPLPPDPHRPHARLQRPLGGAIAHDGNLWSKGKGKKEWQFNKYILFGNVIIFSSLSLGCLPYFPTNKLLDFIHKKCITFLEFTFNRLIVIKIFVNLIILSISQVKIKCYYLEALKLYLTVKFSGLYSVLRRPGNLI